MSLLMQALKKAEQIKQKQSGIASEEALTLSPKESTAQAEILEKVEVADMSEIVAEQGQFESPASSLTLSPTMDDKPAEIVSSELELTREAVPSAPLIPQATTLAENELKHQTIVPADFDAGTKEAQATSDKFNDTRVMQDLAAVEQKKLGQPDTPDMPKIGAEQKQIAEQAEKIVLIEQKKAKAVFSSKAPQGNQRRIRIGIYTLLSVLAVAGIAYFYWQSMSVGLNSSLVRTPPPLPATTVVPTPTPTPDIEATAKTASPAIAVGTTRDAATTTNVNPTAGTNSVPEASPKPSGASPAKANSEPVSPRVKVVANAANTDASTEASATTATPKARAAMITPIDEGKAIQIRRNSVGNQVNPALSSAYQSFIAGDTVAAKSQYQKALQQEPNNRDALLGMAAIALNARQAEQAGSYYGRLLELDPGDPDAIAGLTSLQQGDPVQSESRLKKSLNQNPQAGAVLFALGNLYAQQSRWSDAQQTYFRAYTTTPGSADYAFNLAVSLDKLNQVKLAREYYQRALTLTQNSSGNFNRSDVQKRITELEASSRD